MSVVLSRATSSSSSSTSSAHMAPDARNALPLRREYMSASAASSTSKAATPQRQPRSAKATVATNNKSNTRNKSNNSNNSKNNAVFMDANDENKSCNAAQSDSTQSSATASNSSSSSSSHMSRCSSTETAPSFAATASLDDCDVNCDVDDASTDATEHVLAIATAAPPKSSSHCMAGRFSESAVPEKLDPAFVLPVRPQDYKNSTRSSLVSFEASTKTTDGPENNNNNIANVAFKGRNNCNNNNNCTNSNFVDVAGNNGDDPFQLFDDITESSRLSNSTMTPRSLLRTHPYDGIAIDVNNHSINNQGVVLYHVDIKGPDGLLSTYTIRRRYRAFKELHEKLQTLIAAYTTAQQSTTVTTVDDAFSAENVPDSPHTMARKHARLQQIAEHSVLSATFTFPALPNGGVWSYLKRHDVRLVEQRKKRFEEILRIAIRHPATRTSAMLDSFLSVAPSLISDRGSSYVSLMDYSVPVLDRQRESIERKQLKQRLIQGRRQRTSSEASSSQS